ncbi:MAG: MBL fold metallo-hydrolase [Saprospiraceae bacterium]|nr:MBL fold metallo-hydrolase [Saprospiraceae bacterium]
MFDKNQKVYLKPNVVIEPLFDQWYAWSHLISPATAAKNITGRHLKIMDSYIMAPKIHAEAVKNPKMLGGPFMDFEGDRSQDVKQMKANTMAKQEDLLALAKAIDDLDAMLEREAHGFSLEPLYDQVPDLLKGYVELVYDLNNNASYRLFESLLYNSKFYKPSSQTIALWLATDDERPFVLSTPRLDEKNVLPFDIDFADARIDALAKMKREARAYDEIKALYEITSDQEALFESFFTTEAPPSYEPYTGDQVRMRYFGHACILVETKDVSILLDPVISYYGYQQSIDRFSDMDLPDQIDYVLITHNHQDHILLETLLPLRHKIKNIVVPRTNTGALQDPNLKLMFNHIGFENVVEIDEMETIKFADCIITGVPFVGEHCDLNVRAKICHHVQIEDFSMLFVADSCNIENRLYEHIQRELGDIDVVFLGMECDGAPLSWLYGPLLTQKLDRARDQSRRLAGSNFERGRGLVETFNSLELYVYAMGQEPWLEFISSIRYTDESNPIVQSDRLIDYCTGKGIIAERLFGEKEILYNKHKTKLEEVMG